jgi:hypothetical protein
VKGGSLPEEYQAREGNRHPALQKEGWDDFEEAQINSFLLKIKMKTI